MPYESEPLLRTRGDIEGVVTALIMNGEIYEGAATGPVVAIVVITTRGLA